MMHAFQYLLMGLGGLTFVLTLLILSLLIRYKLYFWWIDRTHPIVFRIIHSSGPYTMTDRYEKGMWCSKCEDWHGARDNATKEEWNVYVNRPQEKG